MIGNIWKVILLYRFWINMDFGEVRLIRADPSRAFPCPTEGPSPPPCARSGRKNTARFESGRCLVASFIKTENGPYLCCSLILAKHSLQ